MQDIGWKKILAKGDEFVKLKKLQTSFKFKVGDYVRATIEPSLFHKGYRGILQKMFLRL